jgi:hypothetical protein
MRRARSHTPMTLAVALLLASAPLAAQTSAAGRLAALTPDQRAALQRRLEAWEALPEPMRRERREAFAAWQSLPEEERRRMHQAREAWLALPVAEQQALRARFDALDAGIARGWLLGPVLGRDWPLLHALFAQVPPEERADLLQALRALPAQARDDLAVLAQRIPPHERDALRDALMAQPPAQRAQWLRQRVGP